MRTHKPIGYWPHVPLRTFQRRVRKAFLITLGLIPPTAVGFSFWAASDPPLGNGGAPWDHWQDALFAAAMVAVIGWVFFIILFGMARWIMTGEAPGEASLSGALIAHILEKRRAAQRSREAGPPHPELGEAGDTAGDRRAPEQP